MTNSCEVPQRETAIPKFFPLRHQPTTLLFNVVQSETVVASHNKP